MLYQYTVRMIVDEKYTLQWTTILIAKNVSRVLKYKTTIFKIVAYSIRKFVWYPKNPNISGLEMNIGFPLRLG